MIICNWFISHIMWGIYCFQVSPCHTMCQDIYFYCSTIFHNINITHYTYEFINWWTFGLGQIMLSILFLLLRQNSTWPQTCYVTQLDRELSILFPQPPKCWDYTQHCVHLCSYFSWVATYGLLSNRVTHVYIFEKCQNDLPTNSTV